MSRRGVSLTTLARRAAQTVFLVLFVLLAALTQARGTAGYDLAPRENYSPMLLDAFWITVRAGLAAFFVLLVGLVRDRAREATGTARRLWLAVVVLLLAGYAIQDAATLWHAPLRTALVTVGVRLLQVAAILLFLTLLTARPAPTRNDRQRVARFLRTLVLLGLVVLFAFLDGQIQTRLATPRVPPLQAFFWFDPLLLIATWLSAHALPVAVYAVPAVVAVALIMTVLRRWISVHLVLMLVLVGVAGAIVLAAWRWEGQQAAAAEGHALMPDSAAWVPLPATLLWALGTVVVTMVLGRVFCGWFCPLGTFHAIASRLLGGYRPAKRHRGKAGADDQHRPGIGSTAPWQRAKYYVLAGLLAMALLGGHWGTIFDPLVLLYRTTTTALFPAAQWAAEAGSKAILDAEPQEDGPPPEAAPPDGANHQSAADASETQTAGTTEAAAAEDSAVVDQAESRQDRPPKPAHTLRFRVSESVYEFLRDHVFYPPRQAFLGSGLILGFFLLTLGLNAWRPRFWCRYVCPLGALLGLLAWRPLLRRTVEQSKCNGCDLCGVQCHGAAAASPGGQWKAAECLGCFHCGDSCPRGALRFQWPVPLKGEPSAAAVDLSKRATLAGALGGVAALALMRTTPQARGTTFHPRLIRPPGAREEGEFLKRCTACGLCMKICPSGGLQPCWSEAGLEGLWTPHLVPRIGPCKQECPGLCGQVCPTGAIQPLSVEQKKQVKIGLAAFDVTRCLPYAYARPCIKCEEHCPVETKAIYPVTVEVKDHDGNPVSLQQPRVDLTLCTGCGECEKACVLLDRPGISVFSATESRNPGNQPELGGAYG